MVMQKSSGAWVQGGRGEDFSDTPALPRFPAILILGLGNPLLGDDGVGWRVAEECAKHTTHEVDCHAGGGLSLMERLVGYEQAILIDALDTGKEVPGSVNVCRLEELTNLAAGHLASSHDTTLHNALAAGRAMGVTLPREVMLVTIESHRVYDFSETLSPPVAAAVPRAAQRVQDIVNAWKIEKDAR